MNLNLRLVINDRSIGLLGQNYSLALDKLGVNVSSFLIHPIQPNLAFESQEDVRIIEKQLYQNAQFFDPQATCLTIWHPDNLAESVGRGARCCYSSFELNPLRPREKHHLSNMDLAFFPSKWGCEVAKESGLKIDVDHFPHGVNRSIFNEVGRPVKQEGEPTRFLSVGKWEVRKGHNLLPQIFDAAFTEKDNVELYISHFNPFSSEEELKQWESLYSSMKLRDKVKFVNWVNDPRSLAQLMQQCDCIVSLSRGEAWNLPLLEAMSCGTHVIATNYSGHTEFLNEENAKLVTINGLEPAIDGKWFFGEGQWAYIGKSQVEQSVAHLREIHKLCQDRELGINKYGIDKAEELTWIRATSVLIDKLTDRGLL
jgi:glycosyltransferase involved in cell wall biosynthesis